MVAGLRAGMLPMNSAVENLDAVGRQDIIDTHAPLDGVVILKIWHRAAVRNHQVAGFARIQLAVRVLSFPTANPATKDSF